MAALRRALTIAAALVLTGLWGGVSLAAASVPWATKAGGSSDTSGLAISTLSDGSAVVTGYFLGTATFGSTTLTSAGGGDVFVAKIDASGAYLWATKAGGTAHVLGMGVSTLSDGSAIVTGYFQGTATFGSTRLTSAGSNDVFVAKIDASGAYVWATRAGGSSLVNGVAISTLSDGSSIVTGYFRGTATFGSTTLTSTSRVSNDVFVAKIDASGAYVWATRAGGSGGSSDTFGLAISTLSDGSAVVTGVFQGTATFGSTTLTSAGSSDVFVAKIDASGTYLWATKAGGTSTDYGYAISTLSDGSAIVTGYFNGTAVFGSTTLTSAGVNDVFVAKIDASGAYLWATQAGGTSGDIGKGISTLSDGSAIVTGYFRGTATFGSTTLTSAGSDDVFVAKIDASGAYLWATKAGGTAGVLGRGVSTLSDGSAIVIGDFQGTAAFGSTTLTSAGGYDVFVAKIQALSAPGAPTSAAASAGDAQATLSWSAPASDGGSAITSYTATASPGGATCTANAPATTCTVTGLTNGTPYTFAVTAMNTVGTSPASVSSASVTPATPTPTPGPSPTPTPTPTTTPTPGLSPVPTPASATSPTETTSPTKATSSASLRVRLLPSRRSLRAGQAMRLGVRTSNSPSTGTAMARMGGQLASATAEEVRTCVRLPANLVVTGRPAGSLRSGRTVCWNSTGIPAGQQRTTVLRVRAIAVRGGSHAISASARSTAGTQSSARVTAKTWVRTSPRAPRLPVTG